VCLCITAGPFSFQVLLDRDGRIIFSYKQVLLVTRCPDGVDAECCWVATWDCLYCSA